MGSEHEHECRDQKDMSGVKHAELGVFEAEKYYNTSLDGKVCQLPEPGQSKPIRPVAEEKNVGSRSDQCRPKGLCPRSKDRVPFSCFLISLCRDEPKSCPPAQITLKSAQSVAGLIPNGALGSHDYRLGAVRKKADIEESLERKLAVLTWDAIPGSRKVPVVKRVDGYESDASSELFEIESLSVSTRQSVSTGLRQGCTDKKPCLRTPRVSVVRRAGGLLDCSGQKSTEVCETTCLNPNVCKP